MMKKTILWAVLTACALPALAAAPEYREAKYDNGQPRYQGYFQDGKPVGELKRYHENGRLSCLQRFDGAGGSTVEVYAGDGTLVARGAYRGTRREGLWKYYSADGEVFLTEVFENGRRQGESLKFGPEKQVMERMYYKNDELDGVRIQYYSYGNKMAEYHYKTGKLDGPYMSWLDSGDKEEEGAYKEGKKEGVWHYYEYGGPTVTVEYKDGKALNQAELDEEMQRKLDSYDTNPNLPDPETFEGSPDEFFQLNP